MRLTFRRSSIVLVVVSGLVAACGPGSAPTAAPTSVTSAPATAPTAAAASAVAPSSAGGGAGDGLCGLFTTDEVSNLLGKAASAPTGSPGRCTWTAGDGTTVVLQQTTETEICDSEQAGVEASGKGVFDGERWAGLSVTGEAVAGVISTGTCYSIRIAKTSPAPKASDLLAFLKQFTDRAGA